MAEIPNRSGATSTGQESLAHDNPGHDLQIAAMFETDEQARTAYTRLLEQGISAADMDLLYDDSGAGYEQTDEGFWDAIKRFFLPEEDVRGYAEGLRRGHAMLVVRPPASQHDRVMEIVESFDPIDLDAREEEWRQGGWTGATPVAAGRFAGQEPLSGSSIPSAATEGVTPSDSGITAQTTGHAGQEGGTLRPGEEQVLPVVEEQVRIGKRQVGRGNVRVRSYILERPVQEDVTLREETIEVQRRPVDRPAGALPEDAFHERTVEVSAMGEEPVVAKDARVVEEVVIRKAESERTETVRDTERRTEVKVEDDRTNKLTDMPPKPEKS